MNKLDLFNGGHPRSTDDMLFLQSAISDALTALAKGMIGNDGGVVILHGIDFTLTSGGTVLNWTDGWVLINDELCKMDAGNTLVASNNMFAIVETVARTVTYKDGESRDIHLVRKVTISGFDGGGGPLTYTFAVNLNSRAQYSEPNGGYTWSSGPILCRKSYFGRIEMTGKAVVASYSVSTPATLDAPFRPNRAIAVACAAIKNGNKTILMVEIASSGVITINGCTGGDAVTVYFDGISFSQE